MKYVKTLPSGVSEKEMAFIKEYIVDFNGTRAARAAGYPEKSAATKATLLLKKVKIQAALANAKRTRELRVNITQDRDLVELARIAFSDIRNLMT